MHLFCFGFGYVAKTLSARLQAKGAKVCGTTRSGQGGFAFHDAQALSGEAEAALAAASHVLISIPPDAGGSDAAQALAGKLQGKWLGYLSTTGVYGDWQGEWVNEASPLLTREPRSLARQKAEDFWRGQGASLFRLGGIYGPERNALVALQNGTARRIHKEGQVFCRIHVEDIAAALHKAMEQNLRGEVLNVVDDLPGPQAEVVAYAAALMGIAAPPLETLDEAQASPMLRSFYAENRRVKNDRLKTLLGGSLRYPTYKEGLQAEWKAIQSKVNYEG